MIQAARAPVQLLWLDLSFNQLTDIDEALLDLPNLRVLYLHANEIREGAPIRRLGKLKQLTNLTIHGNPIDNQPNINPSSAADAPWCNRYCQGGGGA